VGYLVAIAHSESDTILGPWTHQDKLLYCKDILPGLVDGGHAMIFNDKDGVTKITLHGPNGRRKDEAGNVIDYEHLLIFDLVEKDGTLEIK
jgi:hypothetical protein